MKEKIKIILIVLSVLLSYVGLIVLNYYILPNRPSQFEYTITEEQTVTITGYKRDNARQVVVPAEIEGCPVTEIGRDVFSDKIEIREIVLPDTVTEIKSRAFHGCIRLKRINIPDGVAKIDYGTFTFCASLTHIELPNKLQEIRPNAFYASGLKEIRIPDNISVIDLKTFAVCIDLENVLLPHKLQVIDKFAFSNCRALKEIVIPEGTKSIKDCAFQDCSSLEKIWIPSSVEEIVVDEATWEEEIPMFSNATLIVEPGSYAEEFAKEWGYQYSYK